MIDEIALRKEMDAGAKAEAALTNPAIANAFAAIEANYIEAWRNAPVRDTEAREAAWFGLKNLSLVREELIRAIDGGKVAQAQLPENDLSADPLGR